MQRQYVIKVLLLEIICVSVTSVADERKHWKPPIVINTWNFTRANSKAWDELSANRSALDAIERGCSQCEVDRCDGTVGWGGSPSESGETTLDAMIMDGQTFDVGAVGGLRRIRNAISVARLVLERTDHSLLVGDMATEFAVSFGFREESLASGDSIKMHQDWLANSCQPNFWKNVQPDPKVSCGPYKPIDLSKRQTTKRKTTLNMGHDTIGMVAMDVNGRLASGTSTNGLKFKISGRVGDSPVPGAGSYAARDAGAAAATGDGDVIMRFLLSYQAVENLRRGMDSQTAASDVIGRQVNRTGRPYPQTAVVVLSRDGTYGAACSGFASFPFVVSDSSHQVKTLVVNCQV